MVTIATLLKDAGYHTYMTGKWHLGKTPDLLPSQRGFERTVTMADTGADNWEKKTYSPLNKKANWFADGKEMTICRKTSTPQNITSTRPLNLSNQTARMENPFFPISLSRRFISRSRHPRNLQTNTWENMMKGGSSLGKAGLKGPKQKKSCLPGQRW